MMGLSDCFDWNKTQLTSKAGSEFLFYGLRYNPDEIKSTEGVDICWLEEAQATKQESLDMLIPTIRKEGSEIWVTYNPKNADDPVNSMFVTEGRDNAIVRHVNYDENPWFPDVLRVEMNQLRAINPKLAQRVWDGAIVEIGDGDYFPEEKATIIDALPNDIKVICRGWDLAATAPTPENPSPDSTSGIKIGITSGGDVIIMDRKNKKINSAEVESLLKNTASTDGKRCKIRLPQDPAQAGKAQAKRLTKLLAGYPVTALPVSGNKETRSGALSAQWHAGNVYILRADWNAAYLSEMNDFPKGNHDDDTRRK